MPPALINDQSEEADKDQSTEDLPDEEIDSIFGDPETDDEDDKEICDDNCEGSHDGLVETNEQRNTGYSPDYLWRAAPPITDACNAKADLEKTLHPRRESGYGHKDPKLRLLL